MKFSKNSLKVLKRRFKRLTVLGFLLFFFSGYYPALDFPPARLSSASAQDEIIASFLPQPVQLPHPGYLSNRFSRWHQGIDIATSFRMPVRPITSGIVEEVNLGFWGYGNHVTITHTNGFKSLYGHMGKVFAKIGQEVTTDTTLGEVGMTGFSSGPHTHLEVTHNGEYIDPLLILPEISTIQSLLPRQ